jgi:phosphoribosylformylglycinamidine synthase
MIWCVEVRDRGASSCGTVYLLEGALDRTAVEAVARELLVDPVLHGYEVHPLDQRHPPWPEPTVLILKRPGVMDPVEASARKAVADLGFDVRAVRVGRRVPAGADLKGLANAVVDEVHPEDYAVETLGLGRPYAFRRRVVEILRHDPAALLSSHDPSGGGAFDFGVFSSEELGAVQAYFRAAGREPTDVELETIAQTWSEHCKHKTLTGRVGRYASLLKETIFAATRDLAKPWCLSVFTDNAGVIRFDERWALAVKVETHNHPSAIDPYGGANTGLGGVIRDVLGCGLGARPIFSTDVFCVAPDDRRTLRGVVAGVRDYGNRMGIPTVNGAVFFDEGYRHNPLVFCGTAGLLPIDAVEKGARPGDAIVLAGGRTGRDGIHGATFSSAQLTGASERISAGAVQIGNAIEEKKLHDALLRVRDERLMHAVTDCGAGGLSSAVGEMGAATGAIVHLERVPLKYDGLSYTEIWISEAQERMVLAVPEPNVARVLQIFAEEDAPAVAIGSFTDTRRLTALYAGQEVMDLSMQFLHHGLPPLTTPATPGPPTPSAPRPAPSPVEGPAPDLLALLASPNIASKEWIIRQYDHEVQGGSVVKPLVGARRDGPSDAAVVRPLLNSYRGVAVGCGFAAGEPDPYRMARRSIDEAIRNVTAVGGDPARTALLDNFCWGDPKDPAQMWALLRACEACADAAREFGTPFISGKDSLNNTYQGRSIPPTLLITAVSIVEDVRRCVTSDLKAPGDGLYVVQGYDEMARLIREGRVRACHDVAEGGAAVAAAEMAIGGDLGVEFADGGDLFAEPERSFLVESAEPLGRRIGTVTREPVVLGHSLEALRRAWKSLKIEEAP